MQQSAGRAVKKAMDRKMIETPEQNLARPGRQHVQAVPLEATSHPNAVNAHHAAIGDIEINHQGGANTIHVKQTVTAAAILTRPKMTPLMQSTTSSVLRHLELKKNPLADQNPSITTYSRKING